MKGAQNMNQRYQRAREQLHTRLLILAVWVLANALGFMMLARDS
jgi:hypothetical protein